MNITTRSPRIRLLLSIHPFNFNISHSIGPANRSNSMATNSGDSYGPISYSTPPSNNDTPVESSRDLISHSTADSPIERNVFTTFPSQFLLG